MRVYLNGKPYTDAPGRLIEMLAREGITKDLKGVAVACNGSVVPRSLWEETSLSDGDQIEIVKIMQGG